MRALDGILKFFIIVLSVIAGLYYFRAYIPYLHQVPCSEPLKYNLGEFDSQFKIKKEEFLSELIEAEAIWEKPTGKDLFQYDPESMSFAALKVNLIYDYRQQATDKLEDIGGVVADNRESYDRLRSEFEELKLSYENDKSAFRSRVESFDARNAKYEKEVSYWNDRGGAPEGEYAKLEKERRELKALAAQLEEEQALLNKKADKVNALVGEINRLARVLNLSIEKYNTVNGTRGETFEEGEYREEGLRKEINIYEWSSREKLVRVLAHELGHALGIAHVSGKDSIMYEYNDSRNINLSSEDIAALNSICESDN